MRTLIVHGDPPWDDIGATGRYMAAATAAFGPHDDTSRHQLQSPTGKVSSWLSRRLSAFEFAPTVTVNSGLMRRRLSSVQLPGIP